MKTSSVPIACGTALALMAGAAGAHWLSVRDMVSFAKLMPQQGPASYAPAALLAANPSKAAPEIQPLPDESLARAAKSALAAARREQQPGAVPREASNSNSRVAMAAGGGATEEKLLRLFEDMLAQNQELRDRVADTNRDMMELRFQVDSYHGQFLPLKVEEEPRYFDDGSGGVLPPLDAR
jgi:hypothetical protein